jgi:hypothetical protein
MAQHYTPQFHDDPRRTFVLGVRYSDEAVAFPLTTLAQKKLLQYNLAGTPIVVMHIGSANSAAAYSRDVAGQVLEFSVKDGDFVAGGSRWNPATGQAVDGPWKDQRLERLDALLSFAEAWERFHPQSRSHSDK